MTTARRENLAPGRGDGWPHSSAGEADIAAATELLDGGSPRRQPSALLKEPSECPLPGLRRRGNFWLELVKDARTGGQCESTLP